MKHDKALMLDLAQMAMEFVVEVNNDINIIIILY